MALSIPISRKGFRITGIHKQGIKETIGSHQQRTALATSELR